MFLSQVLFERFQININVMKKIFTLFFIGLLSVSLTAQNSTFERFNNSNKKELKDILLEYSQDGFVPTLKSTRVDQFNRSHSKYLYQKNGNFLEGIDLNIHLDKDYNVYLVNGIKLKGKSSNTNSNVSEEKLQETIQKFIGTTSYKLKDKDNNSFKNLKEIRILDYAKLVYYSEKNSYDLSDYILVYQLDVLPENKVGSYQFIISAKTGEILKHKSNLHSCNSLNVNTHHYGNQEIFVDYDGDVASLHDDCRGITTHTVDDMAYSNPNIPTSDNGYVDLITMQERGVLDAHYVVIESYDCFEEKYQWIGFNNEPFEIDNFYISDLDNAFFDPGINALAFGDGQQVMVPNTITEPLSTLDIGGHEFMHGVINNTGNLFYSGESGALNESYADIFGLAVERHTTGGYDWVLGGECTAGNIGLRSFSNPNAYEDPACYGNGAIFYSDTESGIPTDGFGVHTNSSVMNHWFYLLVDGIAGTNEFGFVYDIETAADLTNIAGDDSFDVMTDLLFFALINNYVGLGANFSSMREATIQAAHDMGHSCAFRENLREAWDAVCVTGDNGDCVITPDISVIVPAVPCIGEIFQFSVIPPHDFETYSYEWNFGDNTGIQTTTVNNIEHFYSQAGTFTVTVELIDNSLASGEVVGMDSYVVSVIEDCEINGSDDCLLAIANNSMDLYCDDETVIFSIGENVEYDPSTLVWLTISGPNVDLNSPSPGTGSETGFIELIPSTSNILEAELVYTPYTGNPSEIPHGTYEIQACVNCTGSSNQVCSITEIIVGGDVTLAALEDDGSGTLTICDEIFLPIEHPQPGESVTVHVTSSDLFIDSDINYQYVPDTGGDHGIYVGMIDYPISNSAFWNANNIALFEIYYTISSEESGCIQTSNSIEINIIGTEYHEESIQGAVNNIGTFCSGETKRLNGSSPGKANWEWVVISDPPTSNFMDQYVATNGIIGSGTGGNGDVDITLDVEGFYNFEYSVTDPTNTCESQTISIQYYYNPLEVPLPLRPDQTNIVECEEITEEFTVNLQLINGVENNVVYFSESIDDHVDITGSEFNPNGSLTVAPLAGNNAVVFPSTQRIRMARWFATKYIFEINGNPGLLLELEFNDTDLQNRGENRIATANNFLNNIANIDYTLMDCYAANLDVNLFSLNVTTLTRSGAQVEVLYDGELMNCSVDLRPCYRWFDHLIFNGSVLDLDEDNDFFCSESENVANLSSFINDYTNSTLIDYNIIAFELPMGSTMNPTGITTYLNFDVVGTYSFLIQKLSMDDVGNVICWDSDWLEIVVHDNIDVFVPNETTGYCPENAFNLTGIILPPDTGLGGSWQEINCPGGSCDAVIIDPENINTLVFLPTNSCEEVYTFRWTIDGVDCDLSESFTITIADDETCDCGGCVNPELVDIVIDWENGTASDYNVSITYLIPFPDYDPTTASVDINGYNVSLTNASMGGNSGFEMTWEGTVTFGPEIDANTLLEILVNFNSELICENLSTGFPCTPLGEELIEGSSPICGLCDCTTLGDPIISNVPNDIIIGCIEELPELPIDITVDSDCDVVIEFSESSDQDPNSTVCEHY